MDSRVIAVDLGATSGRIFAMLFDGERISVDEVARFETKPHRNHAGSLVWDVERISKRIGDGVRAVISSGPVASIGIDTWGVDFALLDESGSVVGDAVSYRDERTDGVMEDLLTRIPKEEIFRATGIQFLPFNTIYQLVAAHREDPAKFERTSSFVMMADLFAMHLTGNAAVEFTNATTTQLFDPTRREWAWELIDRLGLPRGIFPRVISTGETIGTTGAQGSEIAGIEARIPVVAVASHDTGSAVAAVPASEPRFAFLSCGTWSLLGTEVGEPVLSEEALRFNFTNEGGVEGTFRLLKNMMGLWIAEQARDKWVEEGTDIPWAELVSMAECSSCTSLIDPDDRRFLFPSDMVKKVLSWCQETDQPLPLNQGDVLRCIFRSLALKTRILMEQLEELAGVELPVLHMVGGGTRNALLCQFTADALERPVIVGPTEATALGNAGVQLISSGAIENIAQFRKIVSRSIDLLEYEPTQENQLSSQLPAFRRFLNSTTTA